MVGAERVLLNIDNGDTVGQVMEKALQHNSKHENNVIPRLHDSHGFLLPIGPNIEENNDDNLYNLTFVPCNWY
jgi:hypothetical protein